MNDEAQNDENIQFIKALQFTKSHYENFPVISFFIKKDLRKYIAVIYQFARQADDMADEGNIDEKERLTQLLSYENHLTNALNNEFHSSFWRMLKSTIDVNNLSDANFTNLLNAFKQDVLVNRYNDYDRLLAYCKNSANPVGRLILELHGINNDEVKNFSDKICTALQLTNFYQDVSIDILKNRIYLPKEELDIFNVSEEEIRSLHFGEGFQSLMKYQVERTKKLFAEGREILKFLPIRLRLQILVTIKGGEAILKKIEELNYNVLMNRPKLTKTDFTKLFLTALILRK